MTTNDFFFERGIEPPSKGHSRSREYPFSRLEVGERVFIPASFASPGTARARAYKWAKANDIEVSTQLAAHDGESGVWVWNLG